MISENILRGTNLRLTAITKDDLPTLARWQQDAGLLRLWNADAAMPHTEEAGFNKQRCQALVFVAFIA